MAKITVTGSKGKLLSSKTTPAVTGGASNKSGGPTNSSRAYPKGAVRMPDVKKFNPMNTGKSTYGLEGV